MSAVITAAVALTVGTAYSIYAGERAAKQQEAALREQQAANQAAQVAAEKQAKSTEEATNRALSKSPSAASALSSAEQAAKQGGSATMLTGPAGVNTGQLELKKQTLLGA